MREGFVAFRSSGVGAAEQSCARLKLAMDGGGLNAEKAGGFGRGKVDGDCNSAERAGLGSNGVVTLYSVGTRAFTLLGVMILV